MNSGLLYIIQVVFVSGLLYGYYHFVLRNKRFHRYNRFYLLAITVFSLLVPALEIPVYFTGEEKNFYVLETLNRISGQPAFDTGSGSAEAIITTSASSFTWTDWLYALYAVIVFTGLLKIFLSIRYIRRIISRNPAARVDNIRLVSTVEPGTPFSFFNWIFWNNNIPLESDKGRQVFRHELYHIRQQHSFDILYLELLTTIGWINPFFHLIKKETRAIHEFLADEYAVGKSGREEYAELLLMHALNTRQSLVNPFFHNHIKRRIAMITLSKKPGPAYLRKVSVLLVALFAIGLFAFSYRNRTTENIRGGQPALARINTPDTVKPNTEIVVYVDGKKRTDIRTLEELDKKINSATVSHMSILKDAAATKKYGLKNITVVEVYTKANQKEPLIKPGANDTIKPPLTNDNKIFEKVEIEATFPGGAEAWKKFVSDNLQTLRGSTKDLKAGAYTVVLQFIVRTDGSITDVRTLTKFGNGLEENAVQLMRKSPNWIPARQNGHIVNAYRKALVTYTVKDLPPIDKKEVEKPEITLAELRKITPRQLLRIPDEAEIVSYIFTIDQDNGDVAESTNTGETFNEATKKLIAAANDGKLLVLDNISVVMDGRKRRIPSKIYYVKN